VEAKRLLAAVRLPPEYTERMPFQLSGGEKQRVAIARAFATQPDLLIADEPVSSLDVSVQASILNLLNQLQTAQGSALLFISHDLAVVGYLADQIAVIYLGHLMEMAPASEIFEPPYNPYTEALLSAIPQVDPSVHHEQILLEGDTPSPSEVLSGCPFYSRCPRVLGEICAQQPPPLSSDPETGKMSYCHIPLDELRILQQKVFSS
jgi:peptide/nickel transport system ATP-binding protein